MINRQEVGLHSLFYTLLITVVNIPYLKTAIYTFSEHLKDENILIDSKFDYLMKLYNQLLREHQVIFLLFNLFETALRSKIAYELSKVYSTENMDDWLHNENKTPNKIAKVILPKIKEFISQDNGNFEKMSTYEVFDYVMFGDLKSIYFDFWKDVDQLFEEKEYKGHILHEIGKVRFREMLDNIRKARNDIAHHKPLHKSRKKRYKLIEDIEYILLHIGFNLEEAVNNIDPEHKIIKIGYYEKTYKVSTLLQNPSKKNLKEIEKLCQYKGIKNYYQKEILKSDLFGWYGVFKNKDYFSMHNFPKVANDNVLYTWEWLGFLEALSKSTSEEDIECDILLIVNSLIVYVESLLEEGYSVDYWMDSMIFDIIQNFRVDNITLVHLNTIKLMSHRHGNDGVLNELSQINFLDKIFLCDEEIITEFYNIILAYTLSKEMYADKISPVIDFYVLEDIFTYLNQKLNLLQKRYLISRLIQVIESILLDDKYTYISYQLEKINNIDQRYYNDNFPMQILKLLRDTLQDDDVNIEKELEYMLHSKECVLQRLALHRIDTSFESLKKLFISYKDKYPVSKDIFSYELHVLMQNHQEVFTKKEITLIEEQGQPSDFEASEFDFVHGKSPLSQDEIKRMTVDKLITYIMEFRDKKGSTDKVSHQGLAAELKLLVLSTPDFYIDDLNKLLVLNERYFDNIINAYKECISQKITFNLHKVLVFIKNYFLTNISKVEQEEFNIYYSVLEFINILSQDLSKVEIMDDEHKTIVNILVFMHNNCTNENKDDLDEINYISYLLNSTRGRIYISMVEYSLKYARDNKSDEDNKWIIEIEEIFTSTIKSKNNIAIFIALGRYVQNINYLNKIWLDDNFTYIFNKNLEDKYFRASFLAYLSDSKVYKYMYNKLNSMGIFTSALDISLVKENRKRVICYICVSFNVEESSVLESDSLIYTLLQLADESDIRHIIDCFHRYKDTFYSSNLKIIWKELYEKIKSNNYITLYSRLIELIIFVPKLDDEFMVLISQTIKDAQEEKFSFTAPVIKNLYSLIESNTINVAKIYLELVKKFSFGIHHKRHVEKILLYLYENNHMKEANSICNIYGEYGWNEWQEMYAKYNR